MPAAAREASVAPHRSEESGQDFSRLSAQLSAWLGLGSLLLGGAALVGQLVGELVRGEGWRMASIPTGLSMAAMGLAFILQALSWRPGPEGTRLHPVALVLAVGTLLSELWWLRFEAGIRVAWTPYQSSRTALDVGISMVMIAGSLLLGRRGGWRTRLGLVLSGLVLFAGLLSLVGHAFGSAPIYQLGRLGPVPTSLTGAVGLLLLGAAGMALPPLSGPMAVLLSPRLGGIAARRVLLFLLAVPLIAKAAQLGVKWGLFQADTALALTSLLSASVCAFLVVRLGTQLNAVDQELEGIRRAVARRGDWLASVIEQLPEAVLIFDLDGRINLFNGSARRLIPGLRMGEWLGQAPPELLMALSEALAEALSNGRPTVGQEVTLGLPDGGQAQLLAGVGPLRTGDDGGGGVVVVLQDVGAMKELERLREEWTAVVAHDLRQPVAVISLAAQQLLRKPDMEQARRLQLASRILEVSNGLGRMVSDLLDASRIESRRMEVTPVKLDLGTELASVVRYLEDLTPGHPIHLDLPSEPLPVRVDVQRLRQVMGNLLTNAAKYGFPDEPIRVSVERRGDEAVVGVHNQGTSLPPEQLARLFQRYSRINGAVSSTRPGVGLGLYITRGLVEAHGGRVWAESSGGTVSVYFALPLGATVAETAPAGTSPASKPEPLH